MRALSIRLLLAGIGKYVISGDDTTAQVWDAKMGNKYQLFLTKILFIQLSLARMVDMSFLVGDVQR